jgi:predicted amidohydrolase
MKDLLKVAIIQTNIIWENSNQNRINFSTKIDAISHDVDLIILQEMFTTGFTNQAQNVFESMDGETVKWMLQKSHEKETLLIGSLIIKEGEKFFNRLIVAFPDGELKYYDKRHLFSYAGEDELFTAGNSRLVFDYKGFKICPLVCYDLRFPVWSRNTEDIDILIYVANWPKPRINAWDILLKARAIENLCYVIGVNRQGKDFNNLEYLGHSAVIDAMGNPVLDFEEGQEVTKTIILSKDHIENTRSKFGFLEDKDEFEIVV